MEWIVTFVGNVLLLLSCPVLSNSLLPHELQHARLPYPSLTPGVYSNSWPSSWWCHPTISSSVVPFSSCLQSFLAAGLFHWVSSSHQVAKVLELQLQHSPSDEYSGLISFTIDWLDLVAVQGTLKSLLQHHSSKVSLACLVTNLHLLICLILQDGIMIIRLYNELECL